MDDPTNRDDPDGSYWIRGPRTKRHRYFYPSDDRAGFALMLLIGVLGLIALGVGLRNLALTEQVQRPDLVLCAIGALAAATGLYQASRLRDWR